MRVDTDNSPPAFHPNPHRVPAPLPGVASLPQNYTRAGIPDPFHWYASCIPESRNYSRSSQNAAPPPGTQDSQPSRHALPSARDTSPPNSQSSANAKSLPNALPLSECNQSTVLESAFDNRRSN